MTDEAAIPAASIGDVDLHDIARRYPEQAREIARLEALMHRGEETREQFLRLCELLSEVGASSEAEYLLRRNLDFYEGAEVYATLFGSEVPDRFARAIDGFAEQLGVELTFRERTEFLTETYASVPKGSPFAFLSRACEVRFEHFEREVVTATVSDDGGELAVLECHAGRWTIDEE